MLYWQDFIDSEGYKCFIEDVLGLSSDELVSILVEKGIIESEKIEECDDEQVKCAETYINVATLLQKNSAY